MPAAADDAAASEDVEEIDEASRITERHAQDEREMDSLDKQISALLRPVDGVDDPEHAPSGTLEARSV